MSELRLNLITRAWVIIATERAKRPHDFKGLPLGRSLPEYTLACPFCPGNEDKTPDESIRIGSADRWRIRVFPNKFGALSSEGDRVREHKGIKRLVSGVGRHEVIVETPLHNMNPALYEPAHLAEILSIYRNRFMDAYADPRVEHVIIFKNHGEMAGTSLDHPHSQLIATPVVPVQFRDRVQAAMHYFDDTGRCIHCDIIDTEIKEGVRVITDTDHFLTFIPYAAHTPFHTWIFPKRHSASFSDATEVELQDLAFHLKEILQKLYYGLENPDFNLVIRSSRPKDATNEYCHWYISITPRLTKTAGFEMGSGMYINTALPEASAEYLRSIEEA